MHSVFKLLKFNLIDLFEYLRDLDHYLSKKKEYFKIIHLKKSIKLTISQLYLDLNLNRTLIIILNKFFYIFLLN